MPNREAFWASGGGGCPCRDGAEEETPFEEIHPFVDRIVLQDKEVLVGQASPVGVDRLHRQ